MGLPDRTRGLWSGGAAFLSFVSKALAQKLAYGAIDRL